MVTALGVKGKVTNNCCKCSDSFPNGWVGPQGSQSRASGYPSGKPNFPQPQPSPYRTRFANGRAPYPDSNPRISPLSTSLGSSGSVAFQANRSRSESASCQMYLPPQCAARRPAPWRRYALSLVRSVDLNFAPPAFPMYRTGVSGTQLFRSCLIVTLGSRSFGHPAVLVFRNSGEFIDSRSTT